jgi:predicted secreted protein
MKKEEMIALLRSVNCDENTVTAMTNAYEMGFEHGASVYKQLGAAIEDATDVCKALDQGDIVGAKTASQYFWDTLGKVRDME